MIRSSRTPWIALVVLIVFGMFLLGVRYGQEVEKANKLSAEVRRMLPTYFPTLQPTPEASILSYKSFVDPTECRVNFTVEDSWKTTKVSSQSANLSQGGKTLLDYSCAQKNPYKMGKPAASESAQFSSESLKIFQSDSNEMLVVVNQNLSEPLYLRVHKGVLPLIYDSLSVNSKTSN